MTDHIHQRPAVTASGAKTTQPHSAETGYRCPNCPAVTARDLVGDLTGSALLCSECGELSEWGEFTEVMFVPVVARRNQ